ncbi:MAG: LysR substrate-binding domain-containing protein [Blastomonas sp.]
MDAAAMDLLKFPAFDTRQLRYFLAIVEAGSFSKAALILNVAQPALSQTIKDMEAELGLDLLVRLPRGVAPTEAGKMLALDARTVLTQIRIARERLQDEGAAPSGAVGLGVPSSISQLITIPMVQSVLASFPKISFRMSEAMSTNLVDWVLEGRVDLGIVFSNMGRKGLRTRPVLREELVLVGSTGPASPEPGEEFSFPRLSQMNFVLPGSAFGIRKLIDAVDSLGTASFNLVAEVDSLWHIKNLVRQGVGFTILPKFAVQEEVANGTLRVWPIRDPPIRRTVHIVTSSERPQTRAVEAVENVLCALFYQLVQLGYWEAELTSELLESHANFAPYIPAAISRDLDACREYPMTLGTIGAGPG